MFSTRWVGCGYLWDPCPFTSTVSIVISPMTNSESEPQPAAATLESTSISELSLTLRSGGTVDRQYNTDFDFVSPPSVPGNQSSSSPASVPNDMLPTDPLTPSASPVSQIDHIAPGPGSLKLSSIPATSFTAPRENSVSQLNLAPSDPPFGTHDDSRAQELSQHPPTQCPPLAATIAHCRSEKGVFKVTYSDKLWQLGL